MTGIARTTARIPISLGRDNGLPWFDSVIGGNPDITLLLHFDGANGSTTFIDDSLLKQAGTITRAGTAAISTAQSRFGGASLSIGGTAGNYVTVPSSPAIAVGGGQTFCLECFIRTSLSQNGTIFSNRLSGTYVPFDVTVNSNGSIYMMLGNAALDNWWGLDTSAAGVIVANTWMHVALIGNGTNIVFCVNGVQVLSRAQPSWSTVNRPLYIGRGGDALVFPGFIDELRFKKGPLPYTSIPFTPPSIPFA
jgi:hypothetical protein